jgi:hypothetical protein
LGLKIVGETSNDFLCYCPFHSNRHTSSFSVSREKGAYICFNPSCGESGTLVDLIKKLMQKNDFEAMRFIYSQEEEMIDSFDALLNELKNYWSNYGVEIGVVENILNNNERGKDGFVKKNNNRC